VEEPGHFVADASDAADLLPERLIEFDRPIACADPCITDAIRIHDRSAVGSISDDGAAPIGTNMK
jgi:hypothetical protein